MESQPSEQVHLVEKQADHKVADKAFVSHKCLIKNSPLNLFAARFSADGNYIAASYADGTVHIHDRYAESVCADLLEAIDRFYY